MTFRCEEPAATHHTARQQDDPPQPHDPTSKKTLYNLCTISVELCNPMIARKGLLNAIQQTGACTDHRKPQLRKLVEMHCNGPAFGPFPCLSKNGLMLSNAKA
jgi:hypothetical protein